MKVGLVILFLLQIQLCFGYQIGTITSKNETSNGKLLVNNSQYDHGGYSIGSFQMTKSTVDKFLDTSHYSKKFAGLVFGSKKFELLWLKLEKEDPHFKQFQLQFIRLTHYSPVLQKLKQNEIDLITRSRGVKELVFSTANQYGERLTLSIFKSALKNTDLNKLSDHDIIIKIQGYKYANVSRHFRSSPRLHNGIKSRIGREMLELLAL